MNDKLFVSVLALGIATLGATASPSQAATSNLSAKLISSSNGVTIYWVDNLTLTDNSSKWVHGYEYKSTDGAPAVVVRDIATSASGPGAFSASVPIDQPGNGNTTATFFLNVVSFVPVPNQTQFTSLVTNVGSATETNGIVNFSF